MFQISTKPTKSPTVINMTPDEWCNLEDCSRQRNTTKHARSASARHLSDIHDAHAVVNASRWPDGTLTKLDGHTRAFLWQSGQLEAPEQLTVLVWNVGMKSEDEDFYLTFDNRTAAELNNQLLFGTFRKYGVELESALLIQGGLYAALQHIYGQDDMGLNLPEEIVPIVKMIDRKDYQKSRNIRMCSGFIAAMLASVFRDGEKAFKFWDAYYEDQGTKTGKQWDGVHGLSVIIEREPQKGTGRDQARIRMRRAINCYDAYMGEKTLNRNASEIKITKLVPHGFHY